MNRMYKDILRLWSYVPAGKWRFALFLIAEACIRSSVPIVTAFVLKWAIDAAVFQDMSLLWAAAGAIFISSLLVAAFSPVLLYRIKRKGKETNRSIRGRLFTKLVSLSVPTLEQTHSGDFASRLTRDVFLTEEMFAEHLRHLMFYFIAGMGSFIAMFSLDWRFGVMLVVMSTIIAAINFRFIRPMRELTERLHVRRAEASSVASDMMHAYTAIKLYGAEKELLSRYDTRNASIQHDTMRFGVRAAALDAMNYLLTFASFGGIVVSGAYLVMTGQIGTGTLIALIQLQMNVTFIILALGGIMANMQYAATAAERIDELLGKNAVESGGDIRISLSPQQQSKTQAQSKVQSQPQLLPQVEAQAQTQEQVQSQQLSHAQLETQNTAAQPVYAIELDNVSFDYGGEIVLNHLSLKLPQGQLGAISGPSGSGKSTLCKLLLGFYPPTSGRIALGGRSSETYAPGDWQRQIAYVPQDTFLFQGTVEDNIRIGRPDASFEEIVVAAELAGAHKFIGELPGGYQTVIAQNGINLSGGQKQRITIARAFLKDAPFVLLDEPNSALDADSEAAISDAISRMRGAKTCLMIAHRSSLFARADVRWELTGGSLILK